VYAVIAHYLRHRTEVSQYLNKRERAAAAIQKQIETSQGDLTEIRSRLQSRRSAQG
jgi:hypothetical protein